eukprot:10949023-Lingulodinium_polyedra.AAC.1
MGTLVAGDVLVAGLATGSKVTLQGAGEQAEVVATRKSLASHHSTGRRGRARCAAPGFSLAR